MAKRASMTLDGFTSTKPGSAPTPVSTGQAQVKEASKGEGVGRPKTLPADFKTVTVRVSPGVRRALRQASLNHDRPIQQIIADGIADQLARLGVVVED